MIIWQRNEDIDDIVWESVCTWCYWLSALTVGWVVFVALVVGDWR